MIEIREVENIEEAKRCDELLTKLILDEKQYNDNISDDVNIKDYYPNVYNKDNNKLFIAIDNKYILGYIFIKEVSVDGVDTNKEIFIDALYVEEEYRKQGVATCLINRVKQYAIDNNIKYISINVLDANIKAKNLYNKLDFNINSLGLKYKVNK